MHSFLVTKVEPLVDFFYSITNEDNLNKQREILLEVINNPFCFDKYFNFLRHARMCNHPKARAYVYAHSFEDENGDRTVKVGYTTRPKTRLATIKAEALAKGLAYCKDKDSNHIVIPVVSDRKAEYLEQEILVSLPDDMLISGEWYEGWNGLYNRLNLWYICAYKMFCLDNKEVCT